ncbi:oligosaccharide flippase family protein [Draconibacterium sp. IB214405]|uniref:lipopolysaccharide biosynthesis protein n=1 Tax=Draconibacterium sp. IB214405 TaxID=3097352 RepID=UPI002A1118DF|nr:oligosaccharide flippase family protein [Draconibacterium sp. IB214405]MDX8341469.1 oligosaccharide flippase family protein [Draconibacterium sp. IB214405]
MNVSSYFKNIIHRFNQSEFYQNIASLFTGMFISRMVPFVFALAIARLYAPEEFGYFALYLTIASALSIVSTGKYEKAIILVDEAHERKQIISFAQRINSAVNLAALVVVVAIILLIKSEDDQKLNLLLVPFYSYFFSSIQLIRNLYISKKQFRQLSILEIGRAILTGVLQCAFFVFPASGLFLGAVAAQMITFFGFSLKINEASLFRFGKFKPEEKVLAKRYIKFPKFSILSEVMNFISSQLPIFLFKPFFGDKMLGLYSFSHRYISTPVQLLSVSISSVYIQNAKSLNENPDTLANSTFSLFRKQVILGIIPFTILGFWGEQIFSLIFGAEWAFSGYLAQLISPWLFFVMLGSPLSAILIVKEKQHVSMWYNILMLIARATSLLIGGLILKDVVSTIVLYSFTGLVFFAFLTIYSLFLAGVNLKHAILYLLKMMLLIVPFAVIKIWLLK